jgi:hypothetical protein
MLLNDVPESKKLAYLLGFHVEQYGFAGGAHRSASRIAVKVAVVTGLLLLSFLWTSGFAWR